MDRISKKKRSWNMSRIKGKDTKPELAVRSFLHNAGFRFRIHRNDLPGNPDIVLPKHRTVVFVHGCFWHRHPNCNMAYTPKSNIEFWRKKFEKTIKRDKMSLNALSEDGWKVIVIWECQSKNTAVMEEAFSSLFKKRIKHKLL